MRMQTGPKIDRRIRGVVCAMDESRHSGTQPRNLGERIERPDRDPLVGLEAGFTRAEYYRYRFREEPPG